MQDLKVSRHQTPGAAPHVKRNQLLARLLSTSGFVTAGFAAAASWRGSTYPKTSTTCLLLQRHCANILLLAPRRPVWNAKHSLRNVNWRRACTSVPPGRLGTSSCKETATIPALHHCQLQRNWPLALVVAQLGLSRPPSHHALHLRPPTRQLHPLGFAQHLGVRHRRFGSGSLLARIHISEDVNNLPTVAKTVRQMRTAPLALGSGLGRGGGTCRRHSTTSQEGIQPLAPGRPKPAPHFLHWGQQVQPPASLAGTAKSNWIGPCCIWPSL